MTIEQHADVLRLTADELARLADARVGTPMDSALLRAASDFARSAAMTLDAAAAHDADPEILKDAQRLARASAAASRSIRTDM
jgi:hypothetical protein